MGQKKLPKLDQPSKRAIQYAAKTLAGSQALAELATRNLAESDTNGWRNISQEHRELICYRIRGGELLTAICRSLNLDPGNIRNLAAMDEEFDHQLAAACSQGQHAQVERLYEIPYDTTLSDTRAKLLSDNIKWIAGRSNRKSYGEHIKVDQTVTVQPVQMPDWSFGQIIESQVILPEDDADRED
jgi:hypothetical protein